MPTLQQIIKKYRMRKKKKSKTPALNKCPQRKGVCLKVYDRPPKKPNSAKRKVTDVHISAKLGGGGKKYASKRKDIRVIGYIPGDNKGEKVLQTHSVVMLRGGRVKDLPGVRYHLVAGKYDFKVKGRLQKRSKYGVCAPSSKRK